PAPPRPALGKPRLVLGQSKDPQEEIQEENQEETLPRIASGKPRRATRWPADFTLTDGRMGLGKDLGVEMPWEWNHFKDHHQAKGSRFLDWDAAWRTWLRNAVDFQERRARRTERGGGPPAAGGGGAPPRPPGGARRPGAPRAGGAPPPPATPRRGRAPDA